MGHNNTQQQLEAMKYPIFHGIEISFANNDNKNNNNHYIQYHHETPPRFIIELLHNAVCN